MRDYDLRKATKWYGDKGIIAQYIIHNGAARLWNITDFCLRRLVGLLPRSSLLGVSLLGPEDTKGKEGIQSKSELIVKVSIDLKDGDRGLT